jgi:threonine dehydratase
LLDHLSKSGGLRRLVVPSMGNTALGAAVGAKAFGFAMTGVVPTTIARAKDEKLQALGVELFKIAGGGSDLLRRAKEISSETRAYFVHPHLDASWTDGYQAIAAEVMRDLPECRTLVFPLGGGGLLMGLTEWLRKQSGRVKLVGCEPFNYPKYGQFDHARTATIADGLLLEHPHPQVQQRIAEDKVEVALVPDEHIRAALKAIFDTQGLFIEPSSAISTALVASRTDLPEPVCVILTGQNIAPEDHAKHRASA